MNDRKIEFWSCDKHDKNLSWTTQDEAIGQYIDDLDAVDMTAIIPVYGYARVKTVVPGVLDDLLEMLDEEYGDPDGSGWDSIATDRMKEAEKAFLKVIEEEYEPWACEIVKVEDVDIGEWIRKRK